MIAVVSSGHKPDDERIYHKEIQSLLKAGYEIQYFTRSNSEISLSKKNLIHCNVSPIKYNINKYINYVAENIDNAAVVLHIHEFELLPLAKKLKRKRNVKIIYDVHESNCEMWDMFSSKPYPINKLINKLLWYFERYHLRYIDIIITVTEKLVDRYLQFHFHVFLVPNFPLYKTDRILPKKSEIIIYHGQLSEERGLTDLICAFAYVININSDLTLKIYGDSRTPEFLQKLNNLICYYGLQNKIAIHPHVNHTKIISILNKCCIGVVPFRDSSFTRAAIPVKIFEYMATGCAVVATDLPLVRQILNGAGELVKPGAAQELADAILKISNDDDLLKQYSAEGVKRIKENYNWNSAERKLIDLYQRVAI